MAADLPLILVGRTPTYIHTDVQTMQTRTHAHTHAVRVQYYDQPANLTAWSHLYTGALKCPATLSNGIHR